MEDNQFLHNIQIYNMLHTYLHEVKVLNNHLFIVDKTKLKF